MASVINQIKLGSVEYAIAASAYAECSTAAGTAAKVAAINTDGDTTNTAFTLIKGVAVNVKFTVTNTAASPTLNINSTGAKAIYYNGAAITAGYLKANKVYQFVYNGKQWDLVGDVDTNKDTGATSVTTTGSGNAVTTASYDAATRKLTLTKGTTFMTSLPARLASAQGTGNASTDADAATETGFHYINPADGTTNNPVFIQTEKSASGTVQTGKDYRILTTAYSTEWLQQIATDFRSDSIALRRKTNYNGWGDWKTVLVGAYDKDSNTITFS
jgi:hypothetical protein